MQGSLIELATRDNLTDASEGALRRGVLDARAARPPHRVLAGQARSTASPCSPTSTAATAARCTTQIAEYIKAGISVEYLFFPRAGIGSESFNKAVSVWCAPDRRKALTDAKNDKPVAKKHLHQPDRPGLRARPARSAWTAPRRSSPPDGTQLGGYLPPDEMLAAPGPRGGPAGRAAQ